MPKFCRLFLIICVFCILPVFCQDNQKKDSKFTFENTLKTIKTASEVADSISMLFNTYEKLNSFYNSNIKKNSSTDAKTDIYYQPQKILEKIGKARSITRVEIHSRPTMLLDFLPHRYDILMELDSLIWVLFSFGDKGL